jgi:FkbM family methyltransferase
MPLFDLSIRLYRKTLKRFRPLHVAIHRLMTCAVIPLLEKRSGLLTMPDDPFWFRLELLTNRHESETLRQVRQLVKPGMIVLDVGAHVGYYTRHCAQLVGPEGRVIAFEPHPRTFKTLRRNVQQFPQVIPAPVAVAEAEGTAELYDYLMMSASGSLHYDETMLALQKAQLTDSDIAPRIATQFPVETYTVRTTPADDYLAGFGIDRVDVIKMDIEGAEMSALRGMQQTIARSPNLYLIMEYNPQALKAFGFEPETALAEVLGMGFARVEAIEPDGTLTDLTHDQSAIAGLTTRLMAHMGVKNLLFTRG